MIPPHDAIPPEGVPKPHSLPYTLRQGAKERMIQWTRYAIQSTAMKIGAHSLPEVRRGTGLQLKPEIWDGVYLLWLHGALRLQEASGVSLDEVDPRINALWMARDDLLRRARNTVENQRMDKFDVAISVRSLFQSKRISNWPPDMSIECWLRVAEWYGMPEQAPAPPAPRLPEIADWTPMRTRSSYSLPCKSDWKGALVNGFFATLAGSLGGSYPVIEERPMFYVLEMDHYHCELDARTSTPTFRAWFKKDGVTPGDTPSVDRIYEQNTGKWRARHEYIIS